MTAAASTQRLRCAICLRAQTSCICQWIRPTAHRVEVLVLQHPLEVANAQTPDYASKRADLQDQATGGVRVAAVRERGNPPGEVDYATELTEAGNAKTLAAAQKQVIRTQQEMLGAVMDMRA